MSAGSQRRPQKAHYRFQRNTCYCNPRCYDCNSSEIYNGVQRHINSWDKSAPNSPNKSTCRNKGTYSNGPTSQSFTPSQFHSTQLKELSRYHSNCLLEHSRFLHKGSHKGRSNMSFYYSENPTLLSRPDYNRTRVPYLLQDDKCYNKKFNKFKRNENCPPHVKSTAHKLLQMKRNHERSSKRQLNAPSSLIYSVKETKSQRELDTTNFLPRELNSTEDTCSKHTSNVSIASSSSSSSEAHLLSITDDYILDVQPHTHIDDRNATSLKTNYEYVSDPSLLRTNIKKLLAAPRIVGFEATCFPPTTCIFPLGRVETKLMELKAMMKTNQVVRPKYPRKKTIKRLKDYPFFKCNARGTTRQNDVLKVSMILKLLQKDFLVKLQQREKETEGARSKWFQMCERNDKISEKIRHRIYKPRAAILRDTKINNSRSLPSPTKISRADYVDDAELEDVLLEIDPL
ncbi:uncharacterized protein KNAG_0C02190 [Huiozyma naganishii CBS 8797]|uniref:Uncharacterized protein n=1 Tax=Huiozyma naganishii (strain ATCC MYA-139 / BCRC 22969 / CBS 8797 / KCTC 17520 / NBRC 10181 / NCYC 3082 / Yp74L-3) TaxID=1071383 RepID=J7R3C4_HUIN7|nr:hypothetical protein KNAG_0C02190 [Kazachstania naganishii CBS 8797]CCK69330.1 hypothetical protein KNAG_0C02190 [Kazachstania naganishii CBS 8797]